MIDDRHIPLEFLSLRTAVGRRLQELTPSAEPLGTLYRDAVRSGRRFRAMLVLAGNRAAGGSGQGILELAVAVELLHKASLVHDDIMDGDRCRRGLPTVAAEHGVPAAVVVGDYLVSESLARLLAAASELPAASGPACMRELVSVYQAMCRGQTAGLPGSPGQDDNCLQRSYQKTGSLLEGALVLGALHAGGPQSCLRTLRRLGRAAGVAFQLADDCNSLLGATGHPGRPRCDDLRRGERTWPVVLLEEALSSHGGPPLATLAPHPDRVRQAAIALGVDRQVQERIRGLLREVERCTERIEHESVRCFFRELIRGGLSSTYWAARDEGSPRRAPARA